MGKNTQSDPSSMFPNDEVIEEQCPLIPPKRSAETSLSSEHSPTSQAHPGASTTNSLPGYSSSSSINLAEGQPAPSIATAPIQYRYDGQSPHPNPDRLCQEYEVPVSGENFGHGAIGTSKEGVEPPNKRRSSSGLFSKMISGSYLKIPAATAATVHASSSSTHSSPNSPLSSSSAPLLPDQPTSNSPTSKIPPFLSMSYYQLKELENERFRNGEREKRSRRCGRRCAICFLIFLVMLFILLAVVLYSIAPRMAAKTMADSTLDVQTTALSDFTPQGFTLALSSKLGNLGPFRVSIDPTYLYLKNDMGENMGRLLMPAQELDGRNSPNGASMNINTNFNLLEPTSYFESFMNTVLMSENVSWHMAANMTIRIENLPLKMKNVLFEKSLTLPGMGGLANQTLVGFDLPAESDCGIIMKCTTRVWNPAPMGMLAGRVGFKIKYDGLLMGTLHLPAMNLKPGWNEWDLSGFLYPFKNEKDAKKAENFFDAFMKGLDSNVTVEGAYIYPAVKSSSAPIPSAKTATDAAAAFHAPFESMSSQKDKASIASIESTVNNSSAAPSSPPFIPWLNRAFGKLSMTLPVPGIKDFVPMKKIDIRGMFLDFTGGHVHLPLSTTFAALYQLPFGFPVQILELKQVFTLKDGDDRVMGLAELPMAPVTDNTQKKEVSGTMKGTLQVVQPGPMQSAFEDFLTALMTTNGTMMKMRGSADGKTKMKTGIITMHDMPVTLDYFCVGMNNMKDPPPIVHKVTMKRGTKTILAMELDISLFNPSTTMARLGSVKFFLYFKEVNIGYSLMDNFELAPGENRRTCMSYFTLKPTHPVAIEFMTTYMNGGMLTVQMKGDHSSSTHPLLQVPLAHLASEVSLNGLTDKLVVSCQLGRPSKFSLSMTTKFKVYNPLDIFVTIKAMEHIKILHNITQSDGTVKEVLIGTINQHRLATPVYLPPRTVVAASEWIPVEIHGSPVNMWKMIKKLLTGNRRIKVRVEGKMRIDIEMFPIIVWYRQTDIPVSLSELDDSDLLNGILDEFEDVFMTSSSSSSSNTNSGSHGGAPYGVSSDDSSQTGYSHRRPAYRPMSDDLQLAPDDEEIEGSGDGIKRGKGWTISKEMSLEEEVDQEWRQVADDETQILWTGPVIAGGEALQSPNEVENPELNEPHGEALDPSTLRGLILEPEDTTRMEPTTPDVEKTEDFMETTLWNEGPKILNPVTLSDTTTTQQMETEGRPNSDLDTLQMEAEDNSQPQDSRRSISKQERQEEDEHLGPFPTDKPLPLIREYLASEGTEYEQNDDWMVEPSKESLFENQKISMSRQLLSSEDAERENVNNPISMERGASASSEKLVS